MPRKYPLVAASMTLLSLSAFGADLTVNIENLNPLEGTVSVALYDSESDWSDDGMVFATEKKSVNRKSMSVVFRDLPKGTYAIRLMHDRNSNGKFDTNIFGIPKDGWGFSNNPKKTGEADWHDAVFETIGEDLVLTIMVR